MINIEEALEILEIRRNKIGDKVVGVVKDFFTTPFILSGIFLLREIETKDNGLHLSFSLCNNEDVEVIEDDIVYNYLGVSKEVHIQSTKLGLRETTTLSNVILNLNFFFPKEFEDMDNIKVEIVFAVLKDGEEPSEKDFNNLYTNLSQIYYQDTPMTFSMMTDKGGLIEFLFKEV